MRFTISGTFQGEPAFLTWEDGKITGGTKEPKCRVDALGKRDDIGSVGPATGPYTSKNHLKSPLSAFELMKNVLDGPHEYDGDDFEQIGPIPPGVVL